MSVLQAKTGHVWSNKAHFYPVQKPANLTKNKSCSATNFSFYEFHSALNIRIGLNFGS